MKTIVDTQWVKSSFMVPSYASRLIGGENRRYMSSAGTKFTDGTLGGNFMINPPAQWTEPADLVVKGINPRSRGMGRKYSEAIDDNAQVIHMRFGVPQFNSLTSFFSSFYDGKTSILSRTGRAPSIFYQAGRAAGMVVTLPLAPLLLVGRVYSFLANKPSSKFYYMKPTMALYWNAVNGILNGIAVNEGMSPRLLGGAAPAWIDGAVSQSDILNTVEQYSTEDTQRYRQAVQEYLPGLFRSNGMIDAYAISTRGQRMAIAAKREQSKIAEASNSLDELRTNLRAWASEGGFTEPAPRFKDPNGGEAGFEPYLNAWSNSQAAQETVGEGESGTENAEENRSWFSQYVDHAQAALEDGAEFVTFKVNHTGTAEESFSNSVGESEIAQSVNGTSAASRAKRFGFADGNIGGVIGGVVEAARQTIAGAMDGLNIEGLAAVFGNAYADIPKEWKDSTASLPRASYTLELRSPYGNPVSRMMNLWVPVSMLLAAVLPKSVGRHAYDMPFLVELYDKGRSQIRLGMIDSMSITRGAGNLGWTRDHKPLGIDITFSVVDMSSVMHMPINSSPGIFDEDNAYTDYLAVLGSLSLSDQVDVRNKLRIRMSRKMEEFKSWTSPAKWGVWTADTLPGRTIRAITRELDSREGS